jgi:hypothetical protein
MLTATKRNTGQFTLSGFYRLLPQLAGSCDPGGEVGGWGPPGLAYQFNLRIKEEPAGSLDRQASGGEAIHG